MPDSSNAPVELGTRSIGKLLKQYEQDHLSSLKAMGLVPQAGKE